MGAMTTARFGKGAQGSPRSSRRGSSPGSRGGACWLVALLLLLPALAVTCNAGDDFDDQALTVDLFTFEEMTPGFVLLYIKVNDILPDGSLVTVRNTRNNMVVSGNALADGRFISDSLQAVLGDGVLVSYLGGADAVPHSICLEVCNFGSTPIQRHPSYCEGG